MADGKTNLDVNVNIKANDTATPKITEFDAALAKLEAHEKESARAIAEYTASEEKRKKVLQESTAKFGADFEEKRRGAKVLEELKKNQQEETSETEKAAFSKHNLKSAVKGLAQAYPELAHVAKLAMNPIMGTVAVASMAAYAVTNFINGVKKLEQHASLQATFGSGIKSIVTMASAMAETRDSMVRSLEDVRAAAHSTGNELSIINDRLLLQHKIAQELDDSQLSKDESEIDKAVAGGSMTKEQGDAARFRAQNEAKDRKSAREQQLTMSQARAEAAAGATAGLRKGALEQTADNMEPKVLWHRKQAELAQEDYAKEKENAEFVKGEIEKDKAVLKMYAEGDFYAAMPHKLMRANSGTSMLTEKEWQGFSAGKDPAEKARMSKRATEMMDALDDKKKEVAEDLVRSEKEAAGKKRLQVDLDARYNAIIAQISTLEGERIAHLQKANQLLEAYNARLEANVILGADADATTQNKLTAQAYEAANARKGQLEAEAEKYHSAGAPLPPELSRFQFSFNDATHKATMSLADESRLQNELLAELLGISKERTKLLLDQRAWELNNRNK